MVYARVLNLEYRSEKIQKLYHEKWRQNNFKGFPEAISRTIIKTGPTSEMMMAVYETEDVAEKARSLANKFLEKHAQHLHEVLDFHGEVTHRE